ncbi:MAG: pantetheine-phosphate adenylyltransferase [Bacilli bacterium]|nr:pantetheine-phosphate adenylyltransferase [Bacilli bacterium]
MDNNKKERIAVYPGSFDPLSNGHLDIIKRACKIFDKLYVLVSVNPVKNYLFTAEERVDMLKKATASLPNVVVEGSSSLVLNYAKSKNACVIIRGMRNIIDYQNEITLFQFNRSIDSTIDTFILFPSTDNLFLSSSSIKELVKFDSDISPYVPKELVEFITKRIKESEK